MPYAPQRDRGRGNAGIERDVVGRRVALEALAAITLPVLSDERVVVVYRAVEIVEDVATEHRCEGHHAPVLRESVDAKGVGDDGREDAEEHTVG